MTQPRPFVKEALDYSIARVRSNLQILADFPEMTQDGQWKLVPGGGWVGGHWTGLVWLAYAHTQDPLLLAAARAWTERLAPRQYDLAAGLLAAAVEDADATGQPVRTCLERRAYAAGHALGRPDVASALADSGYEPYAQGDAIALANCPFHAVAGRHTDLVCGMNLHLVEGLLDAAGAAGLQARLDPSPGHCCVRIEPRAAGAAEAPEPHRG